MYSLFKNIQIEENMEDSKKKNIDSQEESEKDRERIQPVRKYSVLGDDSEKDFIENHRNIETF